MRQHSGLSLLVVVVGLAGLVGCTPAVVDNDDHNPNQVHNDDHNHPRFETYFTYPEPDQPDDTIENRLVEMFESVAEGAEVRGAFYTFSRDRVAEAIGEAVDRGADVQIVLGNTNIFDDGSSWSAVQRLEAHLGDDLTICNEDQDDGGCMGENIHHNKFALFSELEDGSENVVAQTSANLTEDGRRDQYNNMIVLRDAGLHDAMASYWEDLRRDQTDLEYDRHEEGEADTAAYFFPLSSGDPIENNLAGVDCDSGADVYLAVAFFTDSRVGVAEQLRDMDQAGCEIRAMVTESEWVDSPGDEIRSLLASGDIELAVFPEGADVSLHSKYLAVDDRRDDGADRHVVWTGSHNYTWSGLRNNDEVLLEIRDRDVFEGYQDDWYQVRTGAEAVHP